MRKTVTDRQTDSGVKDKIVQLFIDEMLSKGRDEQRSEDGDIILQVDKTNVLEAWLAEYANTIMNPSLVMPGFDPHSDTPMELLHTILLGIAKYSWHSSHTLWKADAQTKFSLHLQAANVDGLTLPPIRAAYIMQYTNSLIGRQCKILVQLATFQLYDIVSRDHLLLWMAIGELAAMLWFPEIDDLEVYIVSLSNICSKYVFTKIDIQNDIETCVANVLDQFSILQPSRITTKLKLHLLVHAVEDIRRFGPLIDESTEIFECNNAIFQACSIYSNKLAPSRDIAIQFAEMEGAKQRISGGFWRDADGNWVQAAPDARLLFSRATTLQNHLGWATKPENKPGDIYATLKQRQTKNNIKFDKLKASQAINQAEVNHAVNWILVTWIITQAGDVAKVGSWVFVTSPLSVCCAYLS